MIFYKKNEKISLVFGIVPITDFWPRFYIVVLGMTFFSLQFTFSNFYLDFYFPFLFGHLFPFSIWTFIYFLDFYFFFRLLFLFWTFISLFAQITIWSWISSKFFFPKICIMYLMSSQSAALQFRAVVRSKNLGGQVVF